MTLRTPLARRERRGLRPRGLRRTGTSSASIVQRGPAGTVILRDRGSYRVSTSRAGPERFRDAARVGGRSRPPGDPVGRRALLRIPGPLRGGTSRRSPEPPRDHRPARPTRGGASRQGAEATHRARPPSDRSGGTFERRARGECLRSIVQALEHRAVPLPKGPVRAAGGEGCRQAGKQTELDRSRGGHGCTGDCGIAGWREGRKPVRSGSIPDR